VRSVQILVVKAVRHRNSAATQNERVGAPAKGDGVASNLLRQ
jgi:hypothetical protein